MSVRNLCYDLLWFLRPRVAEALVEAQRRNSIVTIVAIWFSNTPLLPILMCVRYKFDESK